MLGAGSVIGAVDECFCIADDPVQPLEHLTVRIEHLILVGVSFRITISSVVLTKADNLNNNLLCGWVKPMNIKCKILLKTGWGGCIIPVANAKYYKGESL